MCIPTRTHLTYNNDKPWFTAKLRQLRQAKEDAYRKRTKSWINRPNTQWKGDQSGKEELFWNNKDSIIFQWLCISVERYERHRQLQDTIPSTVENQQLADDLNEFYCRFEKTPHTRPEHLSIQPLTPPATPLYPTAALKIGEDDVRQVFRMNKRRKAPGPDGVSTVCEILCWPADLNLHTNLQQITGTVWSRFKCSTIIPISKKPKITGLNDYRPVVLTSMVMKSSERLVLAYLKDTTGPLLDPLQFAYMGLHFILQHLDRPGAYLRILFVDFSSAFNIIIININIIHHPRHPSE